MREVKLPELLIGVNNKLKITRHFMTASQQESPDIGDICAILATIMAHGCNIDGFVKSRISSFNWIPAFAGMTIKQLISVRYNSGHTRVSGYPDVKIAFYEIVNIGPYTMSQITDGISYNQIKHITD